MSASSKKKLRSAENAEKLTEKQLIEQKEAKKLKIYSIVFAVVIALMVVFAAWTMISNVITGSGIRERSTVAVTIGDHELSNAELNYFYVDAVNEFYSQYGDYASIFGLDLTKPLNEQYVDEEAGTTWADDFLTSAIDNATSIYALADAANKAGYTISEDEALEIENNMSYMTFYASYYGYSDAESYIKAMYGNGATEESLRAYYELCYLAESYYSYYSESLSQLYTDADLRAAEEENYDLYSSFNYNYYYLTVSNFYEEGVTAEDATEEQTAAAQAAALAAAEELAAGTYASAEEFDNAIAALPVNADAEDASSTACENYGYSKISSLLVDWIADDSRQAGDVTCIESSNTSTDEEGNETTTLSGYYVVYFNSSNDNIFPLANVRHILVAYEGGTTDESGNTTYSDEEIAAAKEAAEELLSQWESGDATEESFAALANESSDDGDGTTGGLYEDVYPGQMVTNFNDWCFDESRQVGDTGIVETEYGYHVMYYVGDSDITYRDYQITNALTAADTEEWYTGLIEAMVVTEQDCKYLSTDLVLSAA